MIGALFYVDYAPGEHKSKVLYQLSENWEI